MPLTVRYNGSGSSNLVTASWWNDYHDLLTGIMQDQEVTLKNNLVLQAIGGPPSAAPAGTAVTGTGLGIGGYAYVYTFASPDGESLPSPAGSVTTTSGNQKVTVGSISVGPTGTTARKLYRTVVGGGTAYKLVVSIADNSTTSYTDTTPDASLGVAVPTSPTFGGSLVIKDQTGAVIFTIANDGSLLSGGSGSTQFGTTQINGNLTVTGSVYFPGTLGVVTYKDVLDASGLDTYVKARGSANLVHLYAQNTDVLNAGTSGVIISTGKIGKTSQGDIIDASSSTLYLKANGGAFIFQSPSGTNKFTRTKESYGSVAVGAGATVAVSHGLGVTPDVILCTPNNGGSGSGSQTWSVQSVGTSTFSIYSNANAVNYYWMAIKM